MTRISPNSLPPSSPPNPIGISPPDKLSDGSGEPPAPQRSGWQADTNVAGNFDTHGDGASAIFPFHATEGDIAAILEGMDGSGLDGYTVSPEHHKSSDSATIVPVTQGTATNSQRENSASDMHVRDADSLEAIGLDANAAAHDPPFTFHNSIPLDYALMPPPTTMAKPVKQREVKKRTPPSPLLGERKRQNCGPQRKSRAIATPQKQQPQGQQTPLPSAWQIGAEAPPANPISGIDPNVTPRTQGDSGGTIHAPVPSHTPAAPTSLGVFNRNVSLDLPLTTSQCTRADIADHFGTEHIPAHNQVAITPMQKWANENPGIDRPPIGHRIPNLRSKLPWETTIYLPPWIGTDFERGQIASGKAMPSDVLLRAASLIPPAANLNATTASTAPKTPSALQRARGTADLGANAPHTAPPHAHTATAPNNVAHEHHEEDARDIRIRELEMEKEERVKQAERERDERIRELEAQRDAIMKNHNALKKKLLNSATSTMMAAPPPGYGSSYENGSPTPTSKPIAPVKHYQHITAPAAHRQSRETLTTTPFAHELARASAPPEMGMDVDIPSSDSQWHVTPARPKPKKGELDLGGTTVLSTSVISAQRITRPPGGFEQIHAMEPTRILAGMDPAFIQNLKDLDINTSVFLQFPGQGVPYPPDQAAEIAKRVKQAFIAITGETGAIIEEPIAQAESPVLPLAWIGRNLTPRAHAKLVHEQLYSTPDLTFFVRDRTLPTPKHAVMLVGFAKANGDEDAIKNAIRCELQTDVARDIVARWLADPQDDADMEVNDFRDVAGKLIERATIKCRSLPNGRTIANVYVDNPEVSTTDAWRDMVATFRTLAFSNDHTGYAEHTERHCDICHGSDHATQDCSYPHIHGWHGPIPEGGRKTKEKEQLATLAGNMLTTSVPPRRGRGGGRGGIRYQGHDDYYGGDGYGEDDYYGESSGYGRGGRKSHPRGRGRGGYDSNRGYRRGRGGY